MSIVRFLAASLVVGALLAASGCSKRRPPTSPPAASVTVRVGYIPFSNCLPFFVAQEKRLFRRSLTIKAIRFNDSSQALNALLAGHVDALAGITFSSYWAAEQEEPGRLRLFLEQYETPSSPFSYLLVPKDSSITNVTGLHGAAIGTYTGVSQLLYLRLFLREIGLVPGRNVRIVQVASDLQIPALRAKQYDALFTVEPYGTIALLAGVARVLVASPRTRFIQNPFWGGAAAVTTDYLTHNRKAAALLYDGLAEGVRFIRAHTDEAKLILPKYTPINPTVATKSGLYHWVLLGENARTAGIQGLADIMTKEGVLRGKVDALRMLLNPDDLAHQ